uniref:HNH nuclease domain-containing protein n=1 Tax=viral metagenome TaxID=1070528 RepID=A0A6C0CJF3_9ZZZZ
MNTSNVEEINKLLNLLKTHRKYTENPNTGCMYIDQKLKNNIVNIDKQELLPYQEITRLKHPGCNLKHTHIVIKCSHHKDCFNPDHIDIMTRKEFAWVRFKNKLEILKSKVEDPIKDCWVDNTKQPTKDGYIRTSINCKSLGLHRASYMVYKNMNLCRSKVVRHMCNNKKCCNPNHLEEGTVKQNSEDMLKHGTRLLGEKHPNSKISRELALKIIASKDNGMTRKEKSEHFGVSARSIQRIEIFESFRHLRTKEELDEYETHKRIHIVNKQIKSFKDRIDDKYKLLLSQKTLYPNVSKDDSITSECWGWKDKKLDEYNRIALQKSNKHSRKSIPLHAFSWRYANNNWDDIPKTHNVCHNCGNAGCWNPDHLRLDTRKNNILDQHKHGTVNTKYTEDQVRKFKEEYLIKDKSVTVRQLAAKHNISYEAANNIAHNRSWKHVQPTLDRRVT